MVYPVCFENVKEAKKALFKGYLLGAFTTFIVVTICVLVMGSSLVANLRFPMFFVNKEINVYQVITRIEAVTVSIAVAVSFIAAFSYAYVGVLGLTQLLKLKSYKILILPVGLLLTLYSQFIYDSTDYEIKWDMVTWTPLSFTLGFILPFVLLILSAIKKRQGKT
jgi:spore germination protein KB